MDRLMVYPGAIPLDTDVLSVERNVMKALGWLAQAMLGTSTGVAGLACTPTIPASMSVNIGPGALWAQAVTDQTNFGSLPADSSPLMKMGILPDAAGTNFTLTAPGSSGQSINYLIEAAFEEIDSNPVVLPYVNPANPSQPFTGPDNTGTPQNTMRVQTVALQLKAGIEANTGTQTTPNVDAGYVGLYVITVNFGQTTITAENISLYPNAPFSTGPFAPLAGNANQPFAVGPATEPAQALQSQQIQQVIVIEESVTITPTALTTILYGVNIGAVTVTLNSPPQGCTVIIYGSGQGIITVATNPTSVNFVYPDGTANNTFTLPNRYGAVLSLDFDGAGWRASTIGQPIALPATESNQVTTLGQFSAITPLSGSAAAQIGESWEPSSGSIQVSLNPSCSGTLVAIAAINSGQGSGGPNTLYINGVNYSEDNTSLPETHFACVNWSGGPATATFTSSNYGTAARQRLLFFFIPSVSGSV